MALAHGVDYSRPLGLQQPCGREAIQFLVGCASLVPSVPRVVLVRVASVVGFVLWVGASIGVVMQPSNT